MKASARGTKQKSKAESVHQEQVRAQPRIEQGILTFVFKGVGNTSSYVCVTLTHTDRNRRLDYNK